jgi:heme exporter protein CcmD
MIFAFNNLHDFMSMGQHGVYVWSAWFFALLSISYLILQSRHARQRFIKDEQAKARLQKVRADRIKQESLQ